MIFHPFKGGINHYIDNIWWLPPLVPPHPEQKMEAVRAGNYRDRSVNQAHPRLLLVNSHTHSWNSCKRTLLVWLCWSAYCNYVAFNCALLTLSDWDALGPGTRIRLLLVDCSDGWFFSFYFIFFLLFGSFIHSVMITPAKLHYVHTGQEWYMRKIFQQHS